ncbi:hypothetical protein O9929_15065 [Vibrio lentus]|nr:hypothetical protein [Vibrio lentus]
MVSRGGGGGGGEELPQVNYKTKVETWLNAAIRTKYVSRGLTRF